MSVLCRTVTRFHARREATPEAATAPEATPKAASPEVIIPMAQVTEEVVEGSAAASEPAGAREEPPLVPAGDSTEGYADHVSVLNSSSVFLHFYRVRDSAPDGSSPRGYVRLLAVGRRLILAMLE